MPVLPRMRPCSSPGCPELVPRGESYCPQHKKKAHRDYKRTRTDTKEQAFYTGTRWRKLRAYKLRQDPLCEICLKEGRTKAAELVHHKQEIKQDGEEMALDNLESLCVRCHNRTHKSKGEGGP